MLSAESNHARHLRKREPKTATPSGAIVPDKLINQPIKEPNPSSDGLEWSTGDI